MAYRDTILADAPADFWEMETSTGTDSGSNGKTLTLSAGVTTGVAGVTGNGWSFNNGGASNAAFPNLTTAFTLETWVRSNSNGGWANDYPTFIRRDGTDIVLLRGRGSNITGNVNPGKAEAYIAGTTLLSTNRIDDGLWHHIVLTVSGTAAKLYVDGTLSSSATTSKSTYNFGTGTFYVGSNSTGGSEYLVGRMDNLAIYGAALSATQVTNHFNAAATPGGYSPTPMTASAAMPGGTGLASVNRTVTDTPFIASASMPNAPAHITATHAPSNDYNYDQNGSLNSAGNTIFYIYDSANDASADGTGVIKFDNVPVGVVLESATLSLKNASAGNGAVKTYPILNSFTGSPNTDAAFTLGTPVTLTPSATNGGVNNFDVSGLLNQGPIYGFFFKPVAQDTPTRFYASESAGNGPSLSVTYHNESIPVTIAAQPFIADGALPTASVGFGKDVAATLLTVSADMPSATVVGERYYTHTAEPLQAFAETGQESAFAMPATITAEPLTASAVALDASVGTAQGVLYYADPATATAVWVKPALVNGQPIVLDETEDKYFQRVIGLAPSVWQRLNDLGSTAVDRMATYNGVYHGVQVGKYQAPEGRHSVHFTQGSYIEQHEPDGSNADEAWIQDGVAEASALEFSFRTNVPNAFLMAGADSTQTSKGVASSYAARELYLTNGRLTFRSRIFAGTPDQIDKEFTGVRNLADGQWHTVVVKSGVYSRGEWATEIWIDGTFEIRRFGANGFMGFPDYIGFRPNNIDGSELETLPLSQGFVGDMSEVVFYNHNNLPSHDIARNYYAFMGWSPITPAPFEASAELGNSKGKGSQKKALYLYWDRNDEVFEDGDPIEWSISFDPMPGFVSLSNTNVPNPLEPVGDYHGFKVFAKGVRLNAGYTSYRDPITDDQSLINLESDVDLSEYDAIMFKDWPDEGHELDDIEYNYPGQKQRLVNQLIAANEQGIGLYVTNPRLAVDLGIIDRVEFVSPLTEHKYNKNQGNATGLYDYGSALKFPWNIVGSDGLTGGLYAFGIGETQDLNDSTLSNKAYFYSDTNMNNRYRVKAVIEGLTTIPSYMIEDAVFHVDYDQFGWQGLAYKYLKANSGLQIGDEFIFNGAQVINPLFLDVVERRYGRFNGTWATPPGHVKAGTVVTTFGAKHWVDKTQVDNPYKDYVTTIVLQPGDTLSGRAVGGRIFVNFTEQPTSGQIVVSQVLPDGTTTPWPKDYGPETSAQKSWDYSWTRTTLTSTQTDSGKSVMQVQMPDGTTAAFKMGGKENPDRISMTRSAQLFPIEGHLRMEMADRGMYWLGGATKPEPGAAVVRATAMNATADMPNPVVVGHKTAQAFAQPLLAVAQMNRVKEDTYGDVEVRALPFTAEATFTGYGKTISVDVMNVTAELVEPFDAAHAEGEQVSLILHNFTATLYLKEEA